MFETNDPNLVIEICWQIIDFNRYAYKHNEPWLSIYFDLILWWVSAAITIQCNFRAYWARWKYKEINNNWTVFETLIEKWAAECLQQFEWNSKILKWLRALKFINSMIKEIDSNVLYIENS